MADETLDVPPFPSLAWDGYSWAGTLTLPSWAGFQSRGGAYGSRSAKKPSDGTANLRVAAEDDDLRTPPTPEQVTAFRHLLDNEATVAAAVLESLFEYYPGERAAYAEGYDYTEEEVSKILPELSEPGGLKALLGLSNVHILNVKKDGAAYIGFEFGCEWDHEHAAGVMTHLGRIVEVGQADTSFLKWIARRDAEGRTGSSA